jgi:hypothetical protein
MPQARLLEHQLVLSFRVIAAHTNPTVPAPKSNIYPTDPKTEPVLLLRA